VLEEGKYRGIIKEDQIFLLLTAENTAEMVMGALEYEPDGYLVKPFNKEMVHQRLVKALAKKEELKDVYSAIHRDDLAKAIILCDEKISTASNTALTCVKIQGKLLINLNRYEEAFNLYDGLLKNKKFPWALLGRGKCHHFFKRYDKALADFEAIVALSEVNVEGYDWIARAKLAMGNEADAQVILEKAVRLSPKAILRQQLLGDVAYKNKNLDIAEKAYKWAVQLGKHSCYRRVADYLNYADVLIAKAKSDDHGRVSLRAANDAVVVLENLNSSYSNDRVVQTQAHIMLTAAYHAISKHDKARLVAKKALVFVEKEHIELEKQWLVKLGEALISVDEQEKGQELINNNSSK
jgi:tetratricopeptide (TPR) repeat protein